MKTVSTSWRVVVDIGKRVYLVVKDLIRIQSCPTFDEKAS